MGGRLLLRPDAYRVTTPSGVYALSHQGGCALTGASIARWIDRLAPALDGSHTLETLTAGLAADRRGQVETIISALVDNGLVREVQHAPTADFVGYFTDSAAAALRRYRAIRVAIVGSGPLSEALVRAVRLTGIESVSTTDSVLDDSVLDEVQLIMHVLDPSGLERQEELERLCAQLGIRLAAALVAGDEVWLQPTCVPGPDQPALSDGWKRRCSLADPAGESTLGRAAAAVVASQLAHDGFALITGVTTSTPRRLIRFSARDFTAESHSYLPASPRSLPAANTTPPERPALSEAELRARLAELHAGPPLTENMLIDRLSRLSDEYLGVFGAVSQQNLVQLPLHAAETSVSNPWGADRPRVVGVGPDADSARLRTARRAVAVYGSLALGAGPVRGLDLVEGTTRLLDLDGPSRRWCGAAAGHTWNGALVTGLIQHCRRLIVARLRASNRESNTAYPVVDLDSAPLDQAGASYRRLLAALDDPLVVHDVTSVLGVPSVACQHRAAPAVVGCGASITSALRDGLERLLRCHQELGIDEPPRTPMAPARDPRPLARTVLGVTELVNALSGNEVRAYAVPLDQDDEVYRTIPYLVQVVVLPCRAVNT